MSAGPRPDPGAGTAPSPESSPESRLESGLETGPASRTERGIRGWGRGSADTGGWRRSRDPIGRHTMIAAILGVIAAALIGATADPFNFQTADDRRRAEQAAYDTAFNEARPLGETDGVPHGRTEWIGSRLQADPAATGPWADAFRQGWAQGWNDALDAMHKAATQAGLPPGYTEFDVLDATPRR